MKPTQEEVEKYFENAEIVQCLSSLNPIQLKYQTKRGIHSWSSGLYWIDFENHPNVPIPQNSALLYKKQCGGYAKILKYKDGLEPIDDNSIGLYEIY